MKHVVVIGAGFAGLAAACFLAKEGIRVTVCDKNAHTGGRAQVFRKDGFTFDAGPSWYWMPDVFDRFFAQFGKSPADYYQLVRLDPSYQVVWEDETVPIPADLKAQQQLFETYEPGSGQRLQAFLKEAQFKYEKSMSTLVYQPSLSPLEFARMDVLSALLKMDLLKSVSNHLHKFFRHPKLRQLTEFPVLFLGALPKNTPALYTLMNYADMAGGTWYPMGGMGEIPKAMTALATELGVTFRLGDAVTAIETSGKTTTGVVTEAGERIPADGVIAACDYAHAEEALLPEAHRNYTPKYWSSRALAPSCLLYYVGVQDRVEGLLHHNLFFDADFDRHAIELYQNPAFPEDPLMYVCCPSKTDPSVAPEGTENLFILIPVATDLVEDDAVREQYFQLALERIRKRFGQDLSDRILYKRSFARRDFISEYNSLRGNAYGLANTLMQTAFFKPKIRNKTLRNLFYAGQLTVPGPGVPPSLISGELAALQVLSFLQKSVVGA
ncbi:MAG: phytoene desaturase [Sphingobacteriales bacterium]|nr:MAG: phytoene desaturase [Sphingobacteriales bacterium]